MRWDEMRERGEQCGVTVRACSEGRATYIHCYMPALPRPSVCVNNTTNQHAVRASRKHSLNTSHIRASHLGNGHLCSKNEPRLASVSRAATEHRRRTRCQQLLWRSRDRFCCHDLSVFRDQSESDVHTRAVNFQSHYEQISPKFALSTWC